ncbi:amidase [Bacillus sp. DJP31]|uniref:amidase n=1 Tax=Bacillus sp. DJP31 TaxID=3409789 RepID=UPI003BB6E4E7
MNQILYSSFIDVAQLYRKKEISPVEVLQIVFERQEKLEPELNAFISVWKEDAIKSAKKAEQMFLNGQETHLLTGIPFSVKDLFYTKDIKTTCGSNILRDFVPTYTATVVEKLQQTGAVLFGKNNMLEFAYGIVHPDYGQTNNPWDLTKTAGGSSGGSAAAIAAGIGYFSLGTDTGGSIRIPASYCGTVGLKPTYGLVSTYGVFPLSWSLDHVGTITKSVKETAVLLNLIAGKNPYDSYSAGKDISFISLDIFEEIPPKKIGILPEFKLTSLDSEVKEIYIRTIKLAQSLGWDIETIDIEKWNLTEEMIMNLLLPEAAQIHEKWLDLKDQYAPMTYQQIEMGLKHMALDYLKGVKAQKEFREIVTKAMCDVDVVLMPTVAFPAPAEDPIIGDADQNEMTFTGPFNLSGHPAITINMGFTSTHLPVGIQLVGRHFGEKELLHVAHVLEENSGVRNRPAIVTS